MFHLLFSTGYEPGSQGIYLAVIYLSLTCWLINQMHEKWNVEIVVETPSQYEHSLILNQIALR